MVYGFRDYGLWFMVEDLGFRDEGYPAPYTQTRNPKVNPLHLNTRT